MPTTTYVDDSFGAFAIGARTDDTGAAVDDVSAEESRFINQILTPGIVEPTDGWLVSERGAGANMSVDVGSGVAKSDLAVVEGQVAGQGRYLVRKELATVNVTVPAADVSQARTDEVYLVVADAPYDSGSLALPRIGYRQGDAGGSAPGPDAAWDAYLLLATISVPANDTAITDSQITDERASAALVVDAAPDTFVNLEVEGYAEVASVVLNGTTYTTVASVNVTIPAAWSSWRVFASATGALEPLGEGYLARLVIDGANQQEMAAVTSNTLAIQGRVAGLSTTGSRTISVQMKSDFDVQDVSLYARAVRTS